MTNKMHIHYEDESLLIVEKPAGVPTLPAFAGATAGKPEKDGMSPTLFDLLLKQYPDLEKLPEGGIAHRLDNDTSGLMIVAKKLEIYEKLRSDFHEGLISKEYIALVLGDILSEGTIDTPIAHHPKKKKKMMISKENGRGALTLYRVIGTYRSSLAPSYTLLQLTMKGGVRHQLRLHLASIGHPIAGDHLYQNTVQRKEDILPLHRHFLHASHVKFLHPETDRLCAFTSDLPADLQKVLSVLTERRGSRRASSP